MKKFLFMLGIFFGFFENSFSQDLVEKLENQFSSFNIRFPQEKIYLHSDKEYYTKREPVWFKVYLVDAFSLIQKAPSNLVYVDLIGQDSSIVETKIINTEEGNGKGDFIISDSLSSGKYLLRAYTNFQRNFGNEFFLTKKISVLSINDTINYLENQDSRTIDLQFFPEGGDMVNGIEAWVAFKATDKKGNGVKIEGRVEDSEGNVVTELKSFHLGMGAFPFKPVFGKKYYAILKKGDKWLPKKYPLGRVLEKGYSLRIDNRSEDYMIVSATSSFGKLNGVVITGFLKGKIFCEIKGSDNSTMSLRVFKKNLPEGIAKFTLFSPEGNPSCERLVFIKNPERRIKTQIITDKKTYERKSLVKVSFNTQIKANLSVSVTDLNYVKYDSLGENIYTKLLLTSDLKGRIENPAYYFTEGRKPTLYLDYVMMTHGWRRFSWKKIMKNDFPSLVYYPEKGFNLSGRVTNLYKKNVPVKSRVSITKVDSLFETAELITGDDGKFWFIGYDIRDTTRFFFQANKVKTKKSGKVVDAGWGNVEITLNQNDSVEIGKNELEELSRIERIYNPEKYLKQSEKFLYYSDSAFVLEKRTIVLEEVIVRDTKIDPFKKYGAIHVPSSRLVLDSITASIAFMNVIELIRGRVAGVQISGVAPSYTILIRGQGSIQASNEPLFLLDNAPVQLGMLLSIPVANINHVDVVKGAETAIYGARGANGVIAIYTKRGQFVEAPPPKGTINFTHQGWYMGREFYSPVYEKEADLKKPDYRTTLYWNPNVNTGSTGRASIEFYTSSSGNTTHRIVVQGITDDGRVINSVHYFNVK